ncbi:hypothetical protein IWQ61_005088 [Dispira simplex]|nr:hypothetical protein IWQ61_005088 [Dispira simplex]
MVHVLPLVAFIAVLVTTTSAQQYTWKVKTVDLRSLSEGNCDGDPKPHSRLKKFASSLSLRCPKVLTNTAPLQSSPSSDLGWKYLHGLTVSPASYDVPFVEMVIHPSGQTFRMLVDTSLDGIFLLSSKLMGLPAYYRKVDESALTKIISFRSSTSYHYGSLFDVTQYRGKVGIGEWVESQATVNVVTKFTSDNVRRSRFPVDGIIGLGGNSDKNLAGTLLGKICEENSASFTININNHYDAVNNIELCSPLLEPNPPQNDMTVQASFSPTGEWVIHNVALCSNDELNAVNQLRLLVNPAFAEILPTETLFPELLHNSNVELPSKTHYPTITPRAEFSLHWSSVNQGIVTLTEKELVFSKDNHVYDYLALRPFEDYVNTYHSDAYHKFGHVTIILGRPLFKRYKVYFKYHKGAMTMSFIDREGRNGSQ